MTCLTSYYLISSIVSYRLYSKTLQNQNDLNKWDRGWNCVYNHAFFPGNRKAKIWDDPYPKGLSSGWDQYYTSTYFIFFNLKNNFVSLNITSTLFVVIKYFFLYRSKEKRKQKYMYIKLAEGKLDDSSRALKNLKYLMALRVDLVYIFHYISRDLLRFILLWNAKTICISVDGQNIHRKKCVFVCKTHLSKKLILKILTVP